MVATISSLSYLPLTLAQVSAMGEKVTSAPGRLLNRGIYDLVEVARLIRADPETVSRWARGPDGIVEPVGGRLFTFLDLISLYVVHELRKRKVPPRVVRSGARTLGEELKTKWPLAHRELATVGHSFFAYLDEWVDAGLRGQRAFQEIVQPLLRPIEYDANGLAAIWLPADQIWVNPKVQAGAPCLRGTRIPTALIHSLLDAGEDAEDIADDYGLGVAQVHAADDFEARLAA